ncbi:MAG: flagellar basal body-associated FliL family protein, partial [Alphaproteobacteria bacterium]|nr:flagellar basal body-associated FliL family protein [Alphaproteobacteria bacterium]
MGIVGSLLLHGLVVVASLFTWQHKLDISKESPPVVPVELVTLADKTNIQAMVKKPAEPPKPEPAPEIKPQEDFDTPAPVEAKAPEPIEVPPEPAPVEKPKPKVEPKPAEKKPEKTAEKKPPEKKVEKKTVIVPFGEVVVNLTEDRMNRYLRLKIAVLADAESEKEVTDKLTKQKAAVKSRMIGHLSGKTLKDVSGTVGVNRLQREILEKIDDVIYPDGESKVRDVLFEEYV